MLEPETEKILASRKTFSNYIIFLGFLSIATAYIPRYIVYALYPEFRILYYNLWGDINYIIIGVIITILIKLLEKKFKESLSFLSIEPGIAPKLLQPKFQPKFLWIIIGYSGFNLYSYLTDYFRNQLFISDYLGWFGPITEILVVLAMFFAGLGFCHALIYLSFLNCAAPYLKIDLFHPDKFCGFKSFGNVFLRTAILTFLLGGYAILVGFRVNTNTSVVVFLLEIIVFLLIGFEIFFYPQIGMNKAISNEKQLIIEKFGKNLPREPISSLDFDLKQKISELYNWDLYQRIESVQIFQYNSTVIKKLILFALSPLASIALGLLYGAFLSGNL